MRIIDRYIWREVYSHALLGLAVFTFVLFVPQLVRLMELVVRHSADAPVVIELVLCLLPGVLTFTLPMAVLVGVLLGLGRMSADSETIALHAVGIGARRLFLPVVALAGAATALTLFLTLSIGPAALRQFGSLEQRLRSTQASFEIQPRVFDERFPGFVLYVQDVEASASHWRGLLLAETGGQASRLTLAQEAVVAADRVQNAIQLHLVNGSTHEYSAEEPTRYSFSSFGQSTLPVRVTTSATESSASSTKAGAPLGDLLAATGDERREARVEVHRRLALPAACLVFALAGLPMAVRPRRGGRAAGVVFTLTLIIAYYLLFVTGAGMARRGALTPFLGLWLANLVTAFAGLLLLPLMDQTHGETIWARGYDQLRAWMRAKTAQSAQSAAIPAVAPLRSRLLARGRAFPLRIDLYLLRSFLASLLLILLGFLLLFHSFTFFELLNDIARRGVPFITVVEYFTFLTPYLLYNLLPLAALVAVLVTVGVLAKNNEITAFKASGISMYRLAAPLLAGGLLLAGGMLAMAETWLPYANQRQDALRNTIKGRPAQTFHQPRRQWIFGEGHRLYNYELFDSYRRIFGGLNVFVLDPGTFQMRRRVFARQARWDPTHGAWLLEQAWVRDFEGNRVTHFASYPELVLPELSEPPAYFERPVRRSDQMAWGELRDYIAGLSQAGFDVSRLTVQWHRKLAFPVLAPLVVLLAIPFAFLGGTRGALGGVATAVAIAFAYWALSALFEGMGNVGQLPPALAAWAPDAIFGFVGVYFFLKMAT